MIFLCRLKYFSKLGMKYGEFYGKERKQVEYSVDD